MHSFMIIYDNCMNADCEEMYVHNHDLCEEVN